MNTEQTPGAMDNHKRADSDREEAKSTHAEPEPTNVWTVLDAVSDRIFRLATIFVTLSFGLCFYILFFMTERPRYNRFPIRPIPPQQEANSDHSGRTDRQDESKTRRVTQGTSVVTQEN